MVRIFIHGWWTGCGDRYLEGVMPRGADGRTCAGENATATQDLASHEHPTACRDNGCPNGRCGIAPFGCPVFWSVAALPHFRRDVFGCSSSNPAPPTNPTAAAGLGSCPSPPAFITLPESAQRSQAVGLRCALRRGSPWRRQWRPRSAFAAAWVRVAGQRSSHRIRSTRSLLHSGRCCRDPGATKCPDHARGPRPRLEPQPSFGRARLSPPGTTQIIECRSETAARPRLRFL